ncbi:MAG: acyloxyacyl hydrolase [Thiobacillus sp.]|nr:acyloxyacyl hydrolase [Thiobacillus sp.]
MGRHPVVLPQPGFSLFSAFAPLAVGVELIKRGYARLQYPHYSNVDIEKPNDGIDL